MTGTKTQTPRWRICTGTASGSFSSPLGNMYVTKHFNEKAKHTMMEMVKDIRGEFNNILRFLFSNTAWEFIYIFLYFSEIDWMDGETRGRAKEKLRTMKEYIG